MALDESSEGFAGPAPVNWSRRRARWAAALCLTAAAVVIAYWAVWFTDRAALASSTRPAYTEFENAFPLADAWLTVCLVLAATYCLRARNAAARGWLVAAASSGLYLLGMDSLYDIEHGIWFDGGAGGVVEAVINVLTLAMCILLWWLAAGVPPSRVEERH